MSANTLVTITCDGCGEWWDAGTDDTAAAARRGLRGCGWSLAVAEPGRLGRMRNDYCPRCVKRRAAGAALEL